MEEKNEFENIDFNKMTDDQKFWALVFPALMSPKNETEEPECKG